MEKLPKNIPLFPLPGALLLPNSRLPLNIFEPRYIRMVEDTLATKHRLIGMIQPIKLDPRNADAHVNLGRLYQLEGQLKYAKQHYQMALNSRPEHQLANYNMGTIFDELDELTQASDYYEKAPEVPDAHYNLARIKEIEGDELSAQRHMKEYQLLINNEA